MDTIALIIMVAIVLEALIEYVKTIVDMVEIGEYKTAITQGVTIALGIGLAFIFNLQLFNNALSEFYEGLSINPVIDTILTGILFSRGSNYFSDLVSRLTGKNDVLLVNPDDMIYDSAAPTDTLSSEDGSFIDKEDGD
jgi:hypothetical protein